MMSKKTRKICVVINNRANYARIKYFLKFAKKIKNIDLHIIVGASANLDRYGDLNKVIKKDDFTQNIKYLLLLKVKTRLQWQNLLHSL